MLGGHWFMESNNETPVAFRMSLFSQMPRSKRRSELRLNLSYKLEFTLAKPQQSKGVTSFHQRRLLNLETNNTLHFYSMAHLGTRIALETLPKPQHLNVAGNIELRMESQEARSGHQPVTRDRLVDPRDSPSRSRSLGV
ncbi:unnamed protein product [Lepidochelys olivacea]